jgi:hypothetical protein
MRRPNRNPMIDANRIWDAAGTERVTQLAPYKPL